MKELALIVSAALTCSSAAPSADPVTPTEFRSAGEDRQAIQALLDAYTRAVSTKDRRLFETLLLNQSIPFSSADAAVEAADREDGSRNYARFRSGVFDGEPFTQRFRNVRIEQDGALASVTLVFVNTRPGSSSWGWKTLHLLKIKGAWKIASEFYTTHR